MEKEIQPIFHSENKQYNKTIIEWENKTTQRSNISKFIRIPFIILNNRDFGARFECKSGKKRLL